MNKCRQCDDGVVEESVVATHHYTECGLSRIYLKEIPVRRCSGCGVVTVRIKGLGSLHRTIALAVLSKVDRLEGEEVRFLRKHVGLSGKDFARRMGVTPEMVSRWENAKDGKFMIGAGADRLLRLLVKTMDQIESYPVEKLDQITDKVLPLDLTLSRGRDWRVTKTPAA